MPHEFEIWGFGDDGRAMGLRLLDAKELDRLKQKVTGIDLSGLYSNLNDYLNAPAGGKFSPQPYCRLVNVVWLNSKGYCEPIVFPARNLIVTNININANCENSDHLVYIIIDKFDFSDLQLYAGDIVNVEYVASIGCDTAVVMP